jgi:peroxiredoxin/predicted 2-oxoglutarate/Fe(II)-dependent dioxygenase YbiX
MPFLTPGDPAPWFQARSAGNPRYEFNTVAGRAIVLCLFGSARQPGVLDLLKRFRACADLFNDERAAFFGVSCDPTDEAEQRVTEQIPGFRQFWDTDLKISSAFGACVSPGDQASGSLRYAPVSYVLDRQLRVVAVLPINTTDEANLQAHVDRVVALVDTLSQPASAGLSQPGAPVLLVPRVLEPELCRELIDYYNTQGGYDSGYMTSDAQGRTVGVIDYGRKRRRDCNIDDETLRGKIRARIIRRLIPEVFKAYQFRVTQSERYIVACYDTGEGGYFRPHRDNTTRGTAHRRFAVTMNLNAEEYEGGNLRFPEFDDRSYRAPTGGAVVFSCSLMHEALPVTRGKRYCVLPFLYDDAAAQMRSRIAQEEAAKNAEKSPSTAG